GGPGACPEAQGAAAGRTHGRRAQVRGAADPRCARTAARRPGGGHHRARHGPGVPVRPPHTGAGQRRRAGGGHPRRHPPQRDRARGLSWQGGTAMTTLLELDGLVAGYGPLTVLHEVSFSIEAGARSCLIGRNGVGKSTVLKSIMGLTDWRSGAVRWQGRDIARRSTVERARLGIGYVPQTRDIFPSLSVEENLIAGLRNRPVSAIQRAYQLFPRLKERRHNGGTQLSGGEQQMLSV